MHRRDMLGALGVAGSGLLVASGRSAAGAETNRLQGSHHECVKACQDCSRECNEAFHHCMKELSQGNKDHARTAHLATDCAAFCDLAAEMVASKSPLMGHSCSACAEACKACATECDKLGSNELKECAEACRTCEKACREMARAMS